MDKQRCGVLVNKLVASIGVDMSHFCAVDVKRHLVWRNSRSSRVHDWVMIKNFSEMKRRQINFKFIPEQNIKRDNFTIYFLALLR